MARTKKARTTKPRDRIELMRRMTGQRRDTAGDSPGTPNWRRIEALRERKALLEALREPGMDDPELDETIFFTAPEQARNFYSSTNLPVEEIVLEDELDEDLD